MAAVPAGIYAVKEIHAPVYGLQDIRRRSHAHEIGRLVRRKIRNHSLNNLIHLLVALAHGQAADGVTVQLHPGNLFCVLNPDILVDSSLIDAEQKLIRIDGIRQGIQPFHFCLAAREPAGRPGYRTLHVIAFCQSRRALIEGHGYGRGQIGLNLHALLRPHENLPPVHMGIEIHTLFLNFAQGRQRKYLKSAGIRQNRLIPGHEFVKASQLLHDLIAGAHMKMVGIRQFYLGADLLQIRGGYGSLDGCRCSHIHEHRRLHGAVHGGKFRAFRVSVSFQYSIHLL